MIFTTCGVKKVISKLNNVKDTVSATHVTSAINYF